MATKGLEYKHPQELDPQTWDIFHNSLVAIIKLANMLKMSDTCTCENTLTLCRDVYRIFVYGGGGGGGSPVCM